MTVSQSFFIWVVGVAAVAAGVIFVGVNINYFYLDIDFIATIELVIRNILKVLMCALAVVGIMGMYLSQVRRNGVFGFVGFLVLSAGYLLIMCTIFAVAYVLFFFIETDSSYVEDVLDGVCGDQVTGDIGALDMVFQLQGLCYLAGGLLFGIVLFRARVFIWWAAVLLVVGGFVSAVFIFMFDAFYRLLVYLNGIVMIVFGYSLWRSQHQLTDQTQEAVEHRFYDVAV